MMSGGYDSSYTNLCKENLAIAIAIPTMFN